VYVPAEGPYGGDWVSFLNDAVYSTVDIELYNESNDYYDHEARGVVQALGPGTTTENEYRLRVVDTALVANNIFIGERIEKNTSLSSAVEQVASTFADKNPTFDTVTTQLNFGDITVGSGDFTVTNELSTPRTYKPQSDTIDEVLRDVDKYSYVYTRFERGSGSGTDSIELVADTMQSLSWEADALGGDVQVIENNMLAEINPVNALEMRGNTDTDVQISDESGTVNSNDDPLEAFTDAVDMLYSDGSANDAETEQTSRLPVVRVEHLPTRELAGTRVKQVETAESVSDLDALETRARKRLKEIMDTTGYGNAVTTLAPQLDVYDTIEIPNRCGGTVLKYEIEKLAYHVGARGIPKTEMQCSFATPLDEISLYTSTYQEVN